MLDKRGEDDVLHEPGTKRYRALFVSDLHLGTKACQAEAFLDFLRCHDADRIYLVGDIVDFWRIKRGVYWPQAHNDVLQKLLRKVRKGHRPRLHPRQSRRGHARLLRRAFRRHLHRAQHHPCRRRRAGAISSCTATSSTSWCATPSGSRCSATGATWLALWANTHFNAVRRWLGMPYWSLSAYLKHKVKRAVNYIGEFEMALAQEARRHGAQGVICGHIHHAAMRQVGDVLYINTGDWVESCTAVGETEEGIFEIIRWTHRSTGMQSDRNPRRGARGCRLMRVLVATDAWHPQVNGVVRTYERLAHGSAEARLRSRLPRAAALPHAALSDLSGNQAVAGDAARRSRAHIERVRPDFIHIATEGPIGLMTRRYCRKTQMAVHHELSHALSGICLGPAADPRSAGATRYSGASTTAPPAPSSPRNRSRPSSTARGFERLMPWSRGVDTELFRPRKVRQFGKKPVFLYVGRIAVEKNIKAFLDLDLPGRKVLVGSGPQAAELERLYPDALFAGPSEGEELAQAYASADVFVFPSLTDTFGLVLLEALASGVPVAAFPVSGPKDVLDRSATPAS